jgi:DNA-binding transcriptional MocR family regulator
MNLDSTKAHRPLYCQVSDYMEELIRQGTLRPGDRAPSIRALSRQLRVSINTIKQAYGHLEDHRLLEARPQSGFYVRANPLESPGLPQIDRSEIHPTAVTLSELSQMILTDTHNPDLLQLGITMPNPDTMPVDRLNRMLAGETRRLGKASIAYALCGGYPRLRKQIAKRMLAANCALNPDDVIVTTGCMQAVFLALKATCNPGDVVAVETPLFFIFLQLIEALGLKALEIPASPEEGIHLPTLRYAIEQTPVKACLVVPNFSTPLGSCMPASHKRELVEMLDEHGIPLIEDDIYGELSFSDERPTVAKAFDEKGNVLLCSSFSKTVAPGFRVGWIAPGRFHKKVNHLKTVVDVASPMPTQMAVAEFLANGGYERHLRALRRSYAIKVAQMGDAIGRHFPAGTKVTRPRGGFFLWVEMPEGVDAILLYARALEHGMTIAPGPLFSASGKFTNCIRLNAAFWSERIEPFIATLGRLAKDQR